MHRIPSSKMLQDKRFGLCLTPACIIFKVENFSTKVVLNEKIMSKKYDTANDYVLKGIFLFHKRM